jgi:hypothetical protein
MMELSDCSSCRDGQCLCETNESVEGLGTPVIVEPKPSNASRPLDAIELWRADFEKEIKSRGYDLVRLPDGTYDDYIDAAIEQYWQWFLLGRQTACMEFPSDVSSIEDIQEYGSDFCNGYDAAIHRCQCLIESQGYKHSRKEGL